MPCPQLSPFVLGFGVGFFLFFFNVQETQSLGAVSVLFITEALNPKIVWRGGSACARLGGLQHRSSAPALASGLSPGRLQGSAPCAGLVISLPSYVQDFTSSSCARFGLPTFLPAHVAVLEFPSPANANHDFPLRPQPG